MKHAVAAVLLALAAPRSARAGFLTHKHCSDLAAAAEAGSVAGINEALADGVEADCCPDGGCNTARPIVRAAASGSLAAVNALLAKGADIGDALTCDGIRALSSAAGHPQVEDALVAAGVRREPVVNVHRDCSAYTPSPRALALIDRRDHPDKYQAAAAPAPSAPAAPVMTQADLERVAESAARKVAAETAKAQPAPPAAPQEKSYSSDVDAPKYHDAARPNDVAVIVGVEKYNDLPDAQFAERDAKAVHAHLLALGFAPRNVILLTGSRASRSGIQTSVERKLPELVKPNSSVFFYYSGHGAPDAATGKAYLLPADGDPQYLEDTAYPVSRLYEKLGRLKAKRVLVALDSCFSGAGGRSVLAKGMRPLVTKIDEGSVSGRVTALTASQANEISGSLEEQGHGVFTYYFLKGLSNGRRSFKQLYEYVKPNVEDAARLQNHEQSPALIGADATL